MERDFFEFDKEFSVMSERGLTQVVLLGHMNPDGDAAGCVLGLAHYIHVNYPSMQVFPYLSDKLDKGPKLFAQTDPVFEPFAVPEERTGMFGSLDTGKPFGVIVCDTATRERIIGREYYEKAAYSIVIDHHASDEGYGNVNHTRISEACAVNVYGMVDPKKLEAAAGEGHPNAADYLYLGILHDTGGLVRADVDILTACARLQMLGVDHRQMMNTLNTQTLEDKHKEAYLMKLAQRADAGNGACGTDGDLLPGDGQIAYVVVNRELADQDHISYEDIHPISGLLRDCADIQLGFTMYEEAADLWRCSFRSDGKWINVNELLTPFGGGGHAAAAGLRIQTKDPEGLRKRILDRIRLMRTDL